MPVHPFPEGQRAARAYDGPGWAYPGPSRTFTVAADGVLSPVEVIVMRWTFERVLLVLIAIGVAVLLLFGSIDVNVNDNDRGAPTYSVSV